MRLLGVVLSCLLAISPAAAEPAKQAAPKAQAKEQPKAQPQAAKQAVAKSKKDEKKAEKKTEKKTEKKAEKDAAPEKGELPAKAIVDSYNAIPLAERVAIQSDLIWTGDYNGVLSGEFGDRAIAAVKAFQKRKGAKETGVLNLPERAALAADAKPKQDAVGWRIVDDASTGSRIGVPVKLMPNARVSGGISRWSSQRGETSAETFRIAPAGASLAPIFERMKKEPVGRKTEYSVLKDDFFVISGLQNLKKFYVRAQLRGDEVRGITILYDQAMAGIMEPVVVAMSSAYAPFPTGRPSVPPPRRMVEYASGVAVGPGLIVTSRAALEGCYVVTVAGIGGADRIAEDKEKGLALLRVFAADLKPIALAAEAAKNADVTLLGVLDPQAQGGGGAVSAAKARVSDALTLDPVPALGFDGAAVLDAQGKLAGLTALKVPVVAGAAPSPNATATLLPAEAIRALLAAQKVDPAETVAGSEAKGSVVRVICVRK
jgi:peptidoglycan hydrolase-like protein with peptidoglycan-binding domain